MLMDITVGQFDIATNREPTVTESGYILNHSSHDIGDLNILAIGIGKSSCDWHTTPTPSTYGVGKNGYFNFVHILIFFRHKQNSNSKGWNGRYKK
jgi:hypothetical protein